MKRAYRYAACVTVAAALFGAAGVAVDTYSASSPVVLAASKSRRAKKIRKVNEGISHDLKLAHGWADGTLDEDGNPTSNGQPNDDWAWSKYVDKIKYDRYDGDNRLTVYVTSAMSGLSSADRARVMKSAMRMSYSSIAKQYTLDQYEDIKLGIMTYVKSGGEIVGSSKGLNRYKFKWYFN